MSNLPTTLALIGTIMWAVLVFVVSFYAWAVITASGVLTRREKKFLKDTEHLPKPVEPFNPAWKDEHHSNK